MKFKTVVLCLKGLTCLIVQRSFGNILLAFPTGKTLFWKDLLINYAQGGVLTLQLLLFHCMILLVWWYGLFS